MAPGARDHDASLAPPPEVSHLVTEDGAPVACFLAEKQMRLLTEPLYGAWRAPDGRPFLVAANVGVFAVAKNPAVVPDVFLSLDVVAPKLTGDDRLRSYFLWEFGKPPDVVIEIVSDREGGELSDKLRLYERMRVTHYVVFDPLHVLSESDLVVFSLQGGALVVDPRTMFADLGLGVTLWDGVFEGARERWLRWCDAEGVLVPTGAESAAAAEARANEAGARAEEERARAERLAARLRALGIDPDAT